MCTAASWVIIYPGLSLRYGRVFSDSFRTEHARRPATRCQLWARYALTVIAVETDTCASSCHVPNLFIRAFETVTVPNDRPRLLSPQRSAVCVCLHTVCTCWREKGLSRIYNTGPNRSGTAIWFSVVFRSCHKQKHH